MKEHKWLIGLVGLGLTLQILVFIAAGLTCRQIIHECRTRELTEAEVRQKLREEFADLQLPQRVQNLRGAYAPYRDAEIFIRFETDSEGIAEVLETFGRPGTESKTLDPNDFREMKKFGINAFPRAASWLEKNGINLFDQTGMESGRVLEGSGLSSEIWYKVFIDDRRGTVYIHATQR